MALNATDLKSGVVFRDETGLWQVVTYEHNKMGRGSGTIKVKAKNLKTGATTEKSFITGARVEEADVEKKKAQFLYNDGENFNFMDPQTYEQFPLAPSVAGDNAKYLYEGLEVILLVNEEEALGMELPNSLNYEVAETGPEEKGNTVSNVYKEANMTNGLMVKVPMFMKVGEKIKVDTRTGQYVERVK